MTRSTARLAGGSASTTRSGVTLDELAAVLGMSIPHELGRIAVAGVHDDSRAVEPGDLYLAFPGRHVHGLDFEDQARARGAVAVLSDRPGSVLPTIVVPDPRRAAGPLSAHLHGYPSSTMGVYGITGTNGKTSTAYLLGAALAGAGECVGTITGISTDGPRSTAVSTRTTPEAATLQRSLARFRDEGATVVAMEVSSHAAAQRRVDGTEFAAMGFTNLGPDHLDFHGSMEDYFAAKSALFETDRTRAAAIGIDDHYGRRLAASVEVPCWTFSTHDSNADIFGDSIVCTATGTAFEARTPHGTFDIHLPLLGPHQVHNAVAALALCAANAVDVAAAARGIEKVRTVPGRLERIDEGQSFLAIVDYMHNTSGQRCLLPYLRTLTPGKIIIVLGATGDRDPGKRFPLGAVAGAAADIVIVSDESPFSEDSAVIRDAVAAGAVSAKHATVVVESDRRTAFALAVSQADDRDVVVAVGRGCDGFQTFGDVVVPFDDRVELRRAVLDDMVHRRQRRESAGSASSM